MERVSKSGSGTARFLISCLCLICLPLLVGCGGGGGKKHIAPIPEETAEEITQEAWTTFDQGNVTAALSGFDRAIAKDLNYGPAYVGQGWCKLSLATGSPDLSAALASFNNALARQQAGPDTRAGRAAVLLGLGGDNLGSAVTDAQTARFVAPNYIFTHRQSFNVQDLHLIEAFAFAGLANFPQALTAADLVAASGILPDDPSTWIVSGNAYASFEVAVLAHLQKLSEEHSG